MDGKSGKSRATPEETRLQEAHDAAKRARNERESKAEADFAKAKELTRVINDMEFAATRDDRGTRSSAIEVRRHVRQLLEMLNRSGTENPFDDAPDGTPKLIALKIQRKAPVQELQADLADSKYLEWKAFAVDLRSRFAMFRQPEFDRVKPWLGRNASGDEKEKVASATGLSQPPASDRLTIDLPKKTLTLDGTTYDFGSETALRWIHVLAKNPGEWISGRELSSRDNELCGARTNKLRKLLPQAVLALIDSETGKGSRIRLGRR